MKIYKQCPIKNLNAAREAEYAVIFIGGFVDCLIGVTWRLYRDFEGFDIPMKGVKGYYHWDGGYLGMLADGCLEVVKDLNACLEVNPNLNLVLVGHSYGGSAAMEIARNMTCSRSGELMVLTLDAVSRRQASTRAKGVGFWGNAFLFRGGGMLDVVPRIGGRWGYCSDADVNFSYDGYAQDRQGNFHSHRDPTPMLHDTPNLDGYEKSLLEIVRKRLESNLFQKE